MDKEAEIVTKKIESGEYFSEAMNWFHAKFNRPRTEFAYFSIICLISLIALFVGAAALLEIFPLSPGKNFVLSREIDTGDHVTIHSIQKKGETANDSIMKFMLSQYVRAREEYIEERLNRNFNLVYTFSNDDIFNEFKALTSTSNPQNPVIQYGKQATKDVVINDIKLLDSLGHIAHDGKVKRVIVNYTTILTFLTDNTQQISRNEADISFNYKQITVHQETGKISQTPEMQITSYKINPVKNQ